MAHVPVQAALSDSSPRPFAVALRYAACKGFTGSWLSHPTVRDGDDRVRASRASLLACIKERAYPSVPVHPRRRMSPSPISHFPPGSHSYSRFASRVSPGLSDKDVASRTILPDHAFTNKSAVLPRRARPQPRARRLPRRLSPPPRAHRRARHFLAATATATATSAAASAAAAVHTIAAQRGIQLAADVARLRVLADQVLRPVQPQRARCSCTRSADRDERRAPAGRRGRRARHGDVRAGSGVGLWKGI